MISYDSLYIGGVWTDPATSATIEVHSASTEELIGRVPEASDRDVDDAAAAFDAPSGWGPLKAGAPRGPGRAGAGAGEARGGGRPAGRRAEHRPGGRELGAHLVSHPQVDEFSFTGSTTAGGARPVLSVIPYGTEDEAVAIANDSDYGLVALCGPPTGTAARPWRGAVRRGQGERDRARDRARGPAPYQVRKTIYLDPSR